MSRLKHTGFYGDKAYVLMKLLECLAKRSSEEDEFVSRLGNGVKAKNRTPVGVLQAVDTFYAEELRKLIDEFDVYGSGTVGVGCFSAGRVFVEKDELGEVRWMNGCAVGGYGYDPDFPLSNGEIVAYFRPELKAFIDFMKRNKLDKITIRHEEQLRYRIDILSTSSALASTCFYFPHTLNTEVVFDMEYLKAVFGAIKYIGEDIKKLESELGPSLGWDGPLKNPLEIEAAKVKSAWLGSLLEKFVEEADQKYGKLLKKIEEEIHDVEDSIQSKYKKEIEDAIK